MATSSKGEKKALRTTTFNMELKTKDVDKKTRQASAKQKHQASTPPKEVKNVAASSKNRASPNEKVQQIISYHHKQVECFGKSKFFEKCKTDKVVIDLVQNNIVLTGSDQKKVNKVKDKVKTHCDQIQNDSSLINDSVGSLLTKEDVVIYINKTLDIDSIPVTWCVDIIVDQEHLRVFALTKKEANENVKKILGCVVQNKVSMQESSEPWFQDLLENENLKLFTSKSQNGMIVYCTTDVHQRYFTAEGRKLLNLKKTATAAAISVSNNTAQQTTQPKTGKSQSSNSSLKSSVKSPAVSGSHYYSSLQSSQSHSNSIRAGRNQDTGEPKPDYEGRANNGENKTESVVVGNMKVEYIEKFSFKFLDDICKKRNITCDTSGGQLVLLGDKKSVEVSSKEIKALADGIEVFQGQSFCGKPFITENIKQEWMKIEKEKKCLIHVGRCRKPVVMSGWIMTAETQKLNILSVVGQIHLLDADVILCPVSDTLEPVGSTADLFKTGLVQIDVKNLLQSRPKKQLTVGDWVPVNDPANMNCCCLLLVVQDTTAGAMKDSSVEKVAGSIVTFIETQGYRSLGLLVEDTSFSFPLLHHLWDLRANLKRPVHVYCIASENNFGHFNSFVLERLKIEKYQHSVTMECLRAQENSVSAIKIMVEQGSILEFDGKVDVIVNSVGSDLDLQKGTVSKQLVQRAGKIIQDQCDNIGRIKIGDIAVTVAGNLRCNKIFHVALYIFWESLGDLSIKILKSLMIRCLKETEKQGLSSIAFPALGTGLLGYPPCLVAKVMFEAVEEFGQTNPANLKIVCFVLFEEETVEVFRNVDSWRKQRTEKSVDYDVPPRNLLYTDRDLETRVMILDRDYYHKLSYKELRIVFSDNASQALKLEWDIEEGCFATKIKAPQTEGSLKKSFQDIIQLMHERKFQVADIIVLYPGLSLLEHVRLLIGELIVHGEEIEKVNHKNRKKNILPTINYIKVVRMCVKSEDYDGLVDDCMGENMKQDSRGFWHVSEATAYTYDVQIVGENKNAKDVFKQVQDDISSLEATFKFKMNIKKSEMAKVKKKVDKFKKDMNITLDEDSYVVTGEGTKAQISNVRKDLEQFQEIEICLDMTEDDFATLMYITNNENWHSLVTKYHFEQGKAVFAVEKSANVETIAYLIQNKNNLLHQLSGAEVSPPHQFEDQFPMIQQQVETMGTDIYCFLSLDKKRIIIKSNSYEQAQSAKYMVEVNLGMVPQGGGRRNRVIASSDMGPGPVANKTSVEESAVRDGKKFRTKEGIDIYVYCAGIGNLKAETLVNAANRDLQHGGGIAYHISNAAGYALEKECDDFIRNNGPIPVGSCCTSTAGKLPYKFIIHAVGPMWHSYKHDRKGECLDDLKKTIMSALEMAAGKGLKSIALPSISSGIFGVPKELCAQQYLEAVKTYSHKYQTSAITEIHFIDKDRAMCNLIQKTFEKELGSSQKM